MQNGANGANEEGLPYTVPALTLRSLLAFLCTLVRRVRRDVSAPNDIEVGVKLD
mgnify:CR=1 FL=1